MLGHLLVRIQAETRGQQTQGHVDVEAESNNTWEIVVVNSQIICDIHAVNLHLLPAPSSTFIFLLIKGT